MDHNLKLIEHLVEKKVELENKVIELEMINEGYIQAIRDIIPVLKEIAPNISKLLDYGVLKQGETRLLMEKTCEAIQSAKRAIKAKDEAH